MSSTQMRILLLFAQGTPTSLFVFWMTRRSAIFLTFSICQNWLQWMHNACPLAYGSLWSWCYTQNTSSNKNWQNQLKISVLVYFKTFFIEFDINRCYFFFFLSSVPFSNQSETLINFIIIIIRGCVVEYCIGIIWYTTSTTDVYRALCSLAIITVNYSEFNKSMLSSLLLIVIIVIKLSFILIFSLCAQMVYYSII